MRLARSLVATVPLAANLRLSNNNQGDMTIIDRHNVLARAHSGERFQFELGCGTRKRDPRAIGVDMLDDPGVDLVGGKRPPNPS